MAGIENFAILFSKYFYVFGGYEKYADSIFRLNRTVSDRVARFDEKRNEWSDVGSLLVPRQGLSITIDRNHVWVLGK